MTKLFVRGKIIVNVDETWIGQTDFRRRKWRVPGTTNSMENFLINPRVSMIAAVSSVGELYFSLPQDNTIGTTF